MNPLPRIRARAKFFFAGDDKFFLKGVTYGPFHPNEDSEYFASPERTREDLRLMGEMGANLLRIYYAPPAWFLDIADEAGIRVLISIPWTQHVTFLDQKKIRAGIVKTIEDAVKKNAGHPAIFGYLVGNEIPSSMVRWLGAGRVTEFVEHLINRARKQDPAALFSYASYPPTEYLLPQNVDFYSFNVYLERRDDFERYQARLQNLAGDKPLIFGEFGMDTIRNSEEKQAEVLDWHLDCVVKGGAAGTIFYAWTDEWFTGGMEITDWAFGLVTRDRQPKKAYHLLKERLAGNEPVTSRVKLEKYPRVSIIVCSYNGGKTLKDCLESLDLLNYPDYEIVLVDDGSKDNTQQLVSNFETARKASGRKLPDFQNIVQTNMGLSYARNAGAHAATGEVFAYTDSDCMADPDWLYYLIGTLTSGDYAGVGGPNISPPAVDWIQAAVAAAPGGPSHVLLTDVVAEHIPGCNMAFHKWAFYSIGGFDPEYRKAGDDVDFCWRLQTNGGTIAFSPSAIVWHYRRFTLKAFRKQQEGYGEAESMLRFQHLIFFGPTGTAKWKGMIYGPPRFNWLLSKPIIYHGVFGQGLFQSIYPAPQSEIAAYVSSVEWVALTLFIFVLALPIPGLRIVPFLMFGATFLVALSYMLGARIEPGFDTIRARLLVAFLALTQPLMRGWARYFTWMAYKRTPQGVITNHEKNYKQLKPYGGFGDLIFWNETGQGREALLTEVCASLENENWSYSTDTGWKNWDVQIYGNFWWIVKFASVTEYHGGPKCLTRVKLTAKPTVTTFLINVIVISILTYRLLATSNRDYFFQGAFVMFLAYLFFRVTRLKRRTAELIETAAHRADLRRTSGKVERFRPVTVTPADPIVIRLASSSNEASPVTMRQVCVEAPEPGFRPCEVFVSYDAEGINVKALLTDNYMRNTVAQENGRLWEGGDVFELFLQPTPTGPYFEFHVTPENVRLQLIFKPDAEGNYHKTLEFLPAGSFVSEVSVDSAANRWTVLAKFPYSVLEVAPPQSGDTWRGCFCRYDAGDVGQPLILSSSTSFTIIDFHDRSAWQDIVFTE